MGDNGYANALFLLLNQKPGNGLNPHAPVCSSWVPTNLGTSMRSKNFPLGDTGKKYVCQANVMVSRTIWTLYLHQALGLPWFLEQPINSLMQFHPRFKQFMRLFKIYRHSTSMQRFGAPSANPTWLYSPFPWLSDIERLA